MFRNFLYAFLITFALNYGSLPAVAQTSTAQYVVLFESTWSADTHPSDFPPNPHFSGLIGATHDTTTAFWVPGNLASAGIESMAETGSKFPLSSSVNTAIKSGRAGFLLSGGGISVSPGSVSLTFEITNRFPLVTLVSMLAPSPDWFVGVHGLNLYDGNAWIEEQVVDLFVYDAGTDSGASYTSANLDTQPAEAIAILEQAPFLINDSVEPVGTFTFRLISAVNLEKPADIPEIFAVSSVYPNPFRNNTTLSVTVDKPEYLQIEVFDMLGREVQTVFEGMVLPENVRQFNFDGSMLPAGRYIVKITGDSESHSQLLVRH